MDLYDRLCAPFDHTEQLPRGGVLLDYLTIEQVVSRLNDVLGLDAWSFEVREHGREADTLWSLGRLTVYLPERTILREQFGECATTRGMAEGDARKGAASDALKKCATLIGVGLYLSEKRPANGQQRAATSGTTVAHIGGVDDFWKSAAALLQCRPHQTADECAARFGQEVGAYKAQHGLAWSNVYALLEANVRHGEPIPGGPPSMGGGARTTN